MYVLSPVVVLGLWLLNRRTDRHSLDATPAVPRGAQLSARAAGVAALASAAVFLLSPQTVIGVWGWELTPLTARVVGCLVAQVGVGALWLSVEERWSGWKLIVQTFFLATVLLFVGAARAWDDFDKGRPATWLYLGALVASDLALAVLYRSMTRKEAVADGGV